MYQRIDFAVSFFVFEANHQPSKIKFISKLIQSIPFCFQFYNIVQKQQIKISLRLCKQNQNTSQKENKYYQKFKRLNLNAFFQNYVIKIYNFILISLFKLPLCLQIIESYKTRMKSLNEKIHLADLIEAYHPQRIATYSNKGQILSSEIKDLATIQEFVQSQFSEHIGQLRKKTLQLQKNYKACQRTSKELAAVVREMSWKSNATFAYNIHALNSQERLQRQPRSRVLTQLKLKFLESQGVKQQQWSQWLKRQQGVLAITDAQDYIQIKLGVCLTEERPSKLQWSIRDTLAQGHHHLELFIFFVQYLQWSKKINPNWQTSFISNLLNLLSNMPSIMLLLAMRQSIKTKGTIEQHTFSMIRSQNVRNKFKWVFNLFDQPKNPSLSIFSDEEKLMTLDLKGKNFDAKMYFCSQSSEMEDQSSQKWQLVLTNKKQIKIQNSQFLLEIAPNLHKYQSIIRNCLKKYQKLHSKIFHIFVVCMGQIWLPNNHQFAVQNMDYITKDGVWGFLEPLSCSLVSLQQDLNIGCANFQRGLFPSMLSQKNIQLNDIIDHIRLRQKIIQSNHDFQFKIRSISSDVTHGRTIFTYDFRSHYWMDTKKAFKGEWDDKQHFTTLSYNDFIIVVKITGDFQKVRMGVYKNKDSVSGMREIQDFYLPNQWKEYKKQLRGKYDWNQIYQCINFVCRCYLVERHYNRRMQLPKKDNTKYKLV